jgi:Family of unknown function (DUF5694)
MKVLAMVAAAMAMTASSAARAAQAPAPVEIMVLGTYHFDNPGRDLNNVTADDVTTPKRQAELEALSEALAAFRPTKVMVERQSAAPDLADDRFSAFTPAALESDRNEIVQIGYRVAHRLKLGKVHAIDEQPGPGEPDYFPFGKVAEFAAANGLQPRIDSLMAKGAAITAATQEKMARASIAELLIDHNDPQGPASRIDIYYELLAIGDAAQQPGAELNAMWYMRNAKIFAKLIKAAEPGDRILVVYGSGHNYWLRHFAGSTAGFRNVDPLPYLKAAAGK